MTEYKRGDERIWRVCDVDGPRTSWREAGEIVRCKDCVVLVTDSGGSHCCAHWGRRVPLDGFCHLGEKQEGSNDDR